MTLHRDHAIVLRTYKLGEADRITVLQRGQVIADGTYADVSSNPLVMEAYMGSSDAVPQGAH